MKCLSRSARDAVGIFRKSGVRSRIQKLRDDIEADPGLLPLCSVKMEMCHISTWRGRSMVVLDNPLGLEGKNRGFKLILQL